MWYNISCLDVHKPGRFVFQNAANFTILDIVGKAPFMCGLASRCTSRQRQQAHKGRFFIMGLDNRKVILKAGKKFGRLTVVKEAVERSKNGTVRWVCRCDCGNVCEILGTNLRKGHSTSCGCRRLESVRLKYGEASFNKLYNLYRIGAQERGLSFPLTENQFKKLTSSDCYYCGKEPSRECKNNGKRSRFYGHYIYNGIDRVDNSKGYELGNCVPCCFECNQAKLTLSQKEFLALVKRIYEHLQL